MKKIPFILAIILLSAALLNGCGSLLGQSGGTARPPYTPGKDVDPRQLISKEDAEKLVGNTLKDAVMLPGEPPESPAVANATPSPTAATLSPSGSPLRTPAPTSSVYSNLTCFYETGVTGGHFLQITIRQATADLAAQGVSGKEFYEAMKGKGPSTMSDPRLTMVKGVGEEAFIVAPGIHILFKGYYIVIGVGDPLIPANEDILMAAGKLAVKNLAAILGVPEPTETPAATLVPSPTATPK